MLIAFASRLSVRVHCLQSLPIKTFLIDKLFPRIMQKGDKVPGKWQQVLSTVIVNLSAFLIGMSFGWSSTTIPRLKVKETSALKEPITEDQASWLVAAMAFGSLIVTPFCGTFCERYGRRMIGLAVAVPYTATWLFILFAKEFHHILIAQTLNGSAHAMTVLFAPLYISESVSDSVRGQLGALFVFNVKMGAVCGYTLGAILSYSMFAICGLVIPIIYAGGMLMLPESPVYLVRKHRIDQAIRSLMWFRGYDKAIVETELTKLQEFSNDSKQQQSVVLIDLLSSRGVIRGFLIALTLILGQPACGITVLLSYTVTIFILAKSSVDPYLATIAVGVMQVIGVGIAAFTTERAGRRPLLMASSAGVAICHFSLGIFLLIQKWGYDVSAFSWLPLALLCSYGVAYSIGMGSIPFIIATEVYHPDLASTCHTIILLAMFSCAGLMMKFFPLGVRTIGLDKCFFLFMIPCICVFLLTLFGIPETKGRTKRSIFQELNGFKDISSKLDKDISMESIGK